jgi:hypothetical protein
MKTRLFKLSIALTFVIGTALASAPKTASACVPICDFTRWCCCGKVAATCGGAKVCANFCAF